MTQAIDAHGFKLSARPKKRVGSFPSTPDFLEVIHCQQLLMSLFKNLLSTHKPECELFFLKNKQIKRNFLKKKRVGIAVSIIIHQASSHMALHLGAHCPAGLRQAGPFNRRGTGSKRGYTFHVTSSPGRVFRLFPICSYCQQVRDPTGFEDNGPNPTSQFILPN